MGGNAESRPCSLQSDGQAHVASRGGLECRRNLETFCGTWVVNALRPRDRSRSENAERATSRRAAHSGAYDANEKSMTFAPTKSLRPRDRSRSDFRARASEPIPSREGLDNVPRAFRFISHLLSPLLRGQCA